MKKKSYTQSQLIEIRSFVNRLISLAEENDNRKLPRCFDFCKTICKNITICEANGFTDADVLSDYITEDWNHAMELHCGLPEYYFENTDRDRQMELNDELSKLLAAICKKIETD